MADLPKSSGDSVKASILHPPIMKIDGPPEEKDQKESEDTDTNSCSLPKDEFKMCTPTFRPPALSTNNHLVSPRLNRGILKPPQLSLNASIGPKPFVLKPSQLNPFASKSDGCDNDSEKTVNSNKHSNQVNGETPKFVPLVSQTKPPTVVTSVPSTQSSTSTTTVASSSFVFGENLHDRVIAAESEQIKPSSSLTTNGTSGMLFSAVIKHEVKPDTVPRDKDKETKSLSESAREYEELRANKRKYEEVEVVTGEENEKNIINMSCKLFAFDKAGGNWQERGRGTIRLNDFENEDHIGSRLVFRTSGSLRVVLNTKIWAEMTVDKASEKSIRLTALDAQGEVKVFLIMTNIEDSNRLYNHLMCRLEREIAAQKRKKAESCSMANVI